MTVTWRTLLAETQRAVGGQQVGRWIVEAASGCPSDELTTLLDVEVGERASARLDAMMERLAAGEPLQYVLGSWGFRHLDLAVDPRVLIPRPETELVVDAAL
ncbi:MAG: peptide chain release factor N(5)-glutamine methyltransferase, partial [Actinomycetota bacterium]|nr:peptide chain release factor N(5)-glutamine methyltransferase [Actinomycetota bacterium]